MQRRSAHSTCNSCKFAVKEGGQGPKFTCRLNPPLPIFYNGGEFSGSTLDWEFPLVDGDDWCGHYEKAQ